MRRSISLLLFGIFVSLLIRLYFILNGSQVSDIHALFEMGELTLKGVNPYLALDYNVYPPLSLYLEAWTIQLSNQLNIPFYILTKLWPNLADILITLVLYKFLLKKGVKPIFASLWSLAFALNPISIIISASHGQIDSIPSFLAILAIFFLEFKFSKIYLFLSTFLLSLAIAFKANPLMLLPFFLIVRKNSFKEIVLFMLIVAIPLVVLFKPFTDDFPERVLEKIFNYSGSTDFELPGILRGINYQQNISNSLFFSKEIVQTSKIFFLFGWSLLIVIFLYTGKLIKACLALYLLFFAVYFGISGQYLSWILPLAILEKDKMIIPFSISGTVALIGFYLFMNPVILHAGFSQILAYQSQYMQIYFWGNLFLWLTTVFWCFKIIRSRFEV